MKKPTTTPITSIKHQNKRVNIPPQELSGFMEDEEKAPKTMLYPRDPSLDPQLVWKGKDEQDQEALEVLTVPIYIQEKIQPQAVIENVRREAGKTRGGVAEPEAAYQLNMFGDFNHIEFEDLVEFYQHEQNWTNRMVLGDSLLVMNSLAEKEGLKGKVQMIYIDPPYGIKFGSNWQSRLRKRDVKDGAEVDLTREPEQVKAFRDTWELGIHSYLSYLRDRFVVARELLTESGSIFVQIGDENLHLVRNVLDEVFGSENFIVTIFFLTTSGFVTNELTRAGDYILWYAKDKASGTKYRKLIREANRNQFDSTYHWVREFNGNNRSVTVGETQDQGVSPDKNQFFSPDSITSSNPSGEDQTFAFNGKKYSPGINSHWKANFPIGMNRLGKANRIHISKNSIRYIRMANDFPWAVFNNSWTDTLTGQFTEDKIYVVQTNTKVIERCMLMSTDPGDLVIDPTCGSGTTAYVAEQWGRRWITIDTSRVSIALARMRLMTAKYPFYLLADSEEGKAKEAEVSGALIPTLLPWTGEGKNTREERFGQDIRMGFVYQRVPHITLKSIANNEEIDAIYEKWQKVLEPLRQEVIDATGQNYEEWELVEDFPPPSIHCKEKPGRVLGHVMTEWLDARKNRQKEIDASIAKRADVEFLYDKPYEDNKRIRVCGPFTVESLSPHRVLATDAERPESERLGEQLESGGKFEMNILDNLRTAGVQNTKKGERLNFTHLEPYAGRYLQASGEYEESSKTKRAAVCIGPEHGTVGAELIREAAKEARQGIGFDLLVVLGFAFDPHIAEEVKHIGVLTVLPVRINPDLMMGELLKKTKNANLFTVFGEPDIEVKLEDGRLKILLKGVDIFDPTTGEIRSSSTDDIACWFVDTDYNGESFFARQAYFCGMGDPYDKLKRALRAEVDEGAWSMLYRTESIPFEKPKGGKIAVKVINDYGDEVLKVYEV